MAIFAVKIFFLDPSKGPPFDFQKVDLGNFSSDPTFSPKVLKVSPFDPKFCLEPELRIKLDVWRSWACLFCKTPVFQGPKTPKRSGGNEGISKSGHRPNPLSHLDAKLPIYMSKFTFETFKWVFGTVTDIGKRLPSVIYISSLRRIIFTRFCGKTHFFGAY